MLISKQKKFLFIHIPKAAGNSVESALMPWTTTPPASRVHRLLAYARLPKDYSKRRWQRHGTLLHAQRRIPAEDFHSLYKFSFVRNPWDRLVSSFEYIKARPEHPRHQLVYKMSDFSDYLAYEKKQNRRSQHASLSNAKGELCMDFIGKYEHLTKDFQKVCGHLNIEAELPHLNATKHRDYQEYYTKITQEFVARYWKKDIEAFDYSFGGASTTLPSENRI
ncbi:MAG: sulfotransferase family 2 domain-containing protein [Planctomycetota bacterium]|nr:sulfotransferase family 2 domain-containing protein [Planctomycetota bacterium]